MSECKWTGKAWLTLQRNKKLKKRRICFLFHSSSYICAAILQIQLLTLETESRDFFIDTTAPEL
jgi:hypothetical protein